MFSQEVGPKSGRSGSALEEGKGSVLYCGGQVDQIPVVDELRVAQVEVVGRLALRSVAGRVLPNQYK
jgi:hypothetical protein